MGHSVSKSQQRYNRWYDRNGATRNERRREAYVRDPAARKANIERARKWRKDRAKGVAISREIYKFLDGIRVRVYSTGQVADKVGVSPQTLRVWDQKDLLPKPLFPGTHRYYTRAQVKEITTITRRLRG